MKVTYGVLIDEEFLEISGNIAITFTDIREGGLKGKILQYESDTELGFGEVPYFPNANELLELEEVCNKYIKAHAKTIAEREAEYDLLAISYHQVFLEANM